MTLISDSWWKDVEVKAGSRIESDHGGSGPLEAGDAADLEILGIEFRLPSRTYDNIAYPVKVTITGRTVQWKYGSPRVRVRIEYVNDGEPNTVGGGWLWLD